MKIRQILLAAVLQLSLNAEAQETYLSEQLLRGDAAAQNAVLGSASAYLDELTDALIELLNRIGEERRQANALGEAIPGSTEPEVVTRATNLLIRLRDPRSISALTGVLGTGSTATPFALAAFGERAVGAVLAAVSSSRSDSSLVNSGLVALRCMVAPLSDTRLSEHTVQELRAFTHERLTSVHSFVTILWREIDLAVALEDPELREIVLNLSANRESVRALGVDAPDLIERTQRLAEERLQGVPARPYCE